MLTDGPEISLDQLPKDILFQILANLELVELVPSRQVCQSLRELVSHSDFMNNISFVYLKSITKHFKNQAPNVSGSEVEEILHLIWGNNFFDTYQNSWLEMRRELQALALNDKIEIKTRRMLLALIENENVVSTHSFYNHCLLIRHLNLELIRQFATIIHYTNVDCYGLDLAGIGLTRLPISGFSLKGKELCGLDLSHNFIKYLPEALFQLSELVKLDLENNELQILPESFVKLKNLRYFNLDLNYISGLSAENKSAIKRISSTAECKMLKNQKTHWELTKTISRLFMENCVFLAVLIHDFSSAHQSSNLTDTETENGFQLSSPASNLIMQILQIFLLINALKFIRRALSIITQENHRHSQIPFREDLISYFSNSAPSTIVQPSSQSEGYSLGRESSRSWTTYFQSFTSKSAYRCEFYAGLDDERNHLPSRLENAQDFKSVARKRLGL